MKVKIDNNWHDVNYVDYIDEDGQHQKGRPYDIQDVKIGKRQLFGGYNKWVKVQSRPPEPLQNVLVLSKNGSIGIAQWSYTLRTWLGHNNSGEDIITHWHELPKLPKTE
jgi:hypothetical protein